MLTRIDPGGETSDLARSVSQELVLGFFHFDSDRESEAVRQ